MEKSYLANRVQFQELRVLLVTIIGCLQGMQRVSISELILRDKVKYNHYNRVCLCIIMY